MIQYSSINHREHSLSERETYFSAFQHGDEPHVLLRTCNRIEVYWGEGSIPEQTARHLFRVAAGLESSLVGERAIQGQLKTAYREACEKHTLSATLHRLFQWAIHTGKRVRTETGISEGAVSHSHATAELIAARYPDLSGRIITVIGVNKMSGDILKFLRSRGAKTFFLANRNLSKAEELAREYDCAALPLTEKKKFLAFTDILICTTSAPHPIIRRQDIPAGRKITIFDLSFPRNVDPNMDGAVGVELLDLEQIEAHVHRSMATRNGHIAPAEAIVEQEIAGLLSWAANYRRYKQNNVYEKRSIEASL